MIFILLIKTAVIGNLLLCMYRLDACNCNAKVSYAFVLLVFKMVVR
jgi:hypothetical protein